MFITGQQTKLMMTGSILLSFGYSFGVFLSELQCVATLAYFIDSNTKKTLLTKNTICCLEMLGHFCMVWRSYGDYQQNGCSY